MRGSNASCWLGNLCRSRNLLCSHGCSGSCLSSFLGVLSSFGGIGGSFSCACLCRLFGRLFGPGGLFPSLLFLGLELAPLLLDFALLFDACRVFALLPFQSLQVPLPLLILSCNLCPTFVLKPVALLSLQALLLSFDLQFDALSSNLSIPPDSIMLGCSLRECGRVELGLLFNLCIQFILQLLILVDEKSTKLDQYRM